MQKESNSFMFVVAISCAMGCAFASINALPLEIGVLVNYFEFAEDQAGFIGGIETLTFAIIPIIIGLWSPSITVTRMAFYGASIALFCHIASAMFDSYSALLIFRGAAGAGLGLLQCAAFIAIARRKNADRLLGISTGAQLLFTALIFIIIPQLSFGTAASRYYFTFSFIVLLVMCTLKFLGKATSHEVKSKQGTTPLGYVFAVGGGLFCLAMATGVSWPYVERVAVSLSLNQQETGYILAMSTIFGMLGSALVAFVGARFGRAIIALSAMVLCGLSQWKMMNSSSVELFSIAIYAYWFFFMIGFTYLFGLASDIDKSGRVSAIGSGLFGLGASAGTALGGIIALQFGYSETGIVAALLCASSVIITVKLFLRTDKRLLTFKNIEEQ